MKRLQNVKTIRFLIIVLFVFVVLQDALYDLARTRRPVFLDHVENVQIQCAEKEEGKYYYSEADITSGNYLDVTLLFNTPGRDGEVAHVELLDNMGTVFYLKDIPFSAGDPLEKKVSLDYAHVLQHLETAYIFVYIPDTAETVLQDMKWDRYAYEGGWDSLALAVCAVTWMAIVATICGIGYGSFSYLKKNRDIKADDLKIFFRNRSEYFFVAFLVFVILMFLYRNADLSYPLVHRYISGDEKICEYDTALFARGELNVVNMSAGGMYGAESYDYPFTERIQILLFAVLGMLVKNPYLTDNLFYFLCYFLNAFSAVWVCRKLGYKKSTTTLISVLFAFSPFMQGRYEHLWLTGYFILPIAVYIAIQIVEDNGKDINEWIRLGAGALLCAYTGLYYAFFSCALFLVAIVIRMLDQAKRKRGTSWMALPLCMVGVFLSCVPNLLYWHRCGRTIQNALSLHMASDTETYSLRLVQMVMPRDQHRIGFLRALTEKYYSSFERDGEEWVRSLFVNENISSAIGIIASCGFVISVLWLLKRAREKREFVLSALNISTVLIATSGGLGVLISYLVPLPIRSYNRISTVILFISLLSIGVLLEHITINMRKRIRLSVFLLLMVIGLFDQTIDYKPMQYGHFAEMNNFYEGVKDSCNAGEAIFVLPYMEWPTYGNLNRLMGPTMAEELIWNYPAMMGRPEADWQDMVTDQSTDLLLTMLVNAGYDAVIFDQADVKFYTEAGQRDILEELKIYLGEPQVSNETIGMYFWRL
ncbi:MAG: hypothetical protein J6M27_10440 [Lachnospiraceae bacterium]|nr:hypothetical protein [Lachnospiraceae bacterium]